MITRETLADGGPLWLATEYIPGDVDSTIYFTNFGTFIYESESGLTSRFGEADAKFASAPLGLRLRLLPSPVVTHRGASRLKSIKPCITVMDSSTASLDRAAPAGLDRGHNRCRPLGADRSAADDKRFAKEARRIDMARAGTAARRLRSR